MSTPSFDLIDVVRTIQKQKRIIIIITAIAIALGGIFFVVKRKKFKASSKFLVNNPLYGDRNTLFRNYEQRYVDYFGGDDDLDRVTALLASDTVKDRIIRNCQFQVVYNSDINSEKGHAFLMSVFDKNFNVKRSEYKEMEVSYIAYDSMTAANVANMAVKVCEESFRNYYTTMKMGMAKSIRDKVKQIDSTIARNGDILDGHKAIANLRHMTGDTATEPVMTNQKALGIEQDQLMQDRAKYISLINEIEATTNSSMDYLKVTTRALPPTSAMGPTLTMVLIVAACLGLFFSTLLVLVLAYYNKLMAVER